MLHDRAHCSASCRERGLVLDKHEPELPLSSPCSSSKGSLGNGSQIRRNVSGALFSCALLAEENCSEASDDLHFAEKKDSGVSVAALELDIIVSNMM